VRSGLLTFGTPDVNGKAAQAVGSLRAEVVAGDASTPADEADVMLSVNLTDVRNQSDLLDYSGELQASAVVRITDRANDTGSEAGTVADFTYTFTVPCSATGRHHDRGNLLNDDDRRLARARHDRGRQPVDLGDRPGRALRRRSRRLVVHDG
jgi:hypothetical protein